VVGAGVQHVEHCARSSYPRARTTHTARESVTESLTTSDLSLSSSGIAHAPPCTIMETFSPAGGGLAITPAARSTAPTPDATNSAIFRYRDSLKSSLLRHHRMSETPTVDELLGQAEAK
jgi:hypothetical protein